MAVWTSFGLLAVFCLFNVEAWSTYKECVVYEPGENLRSRGYCRFCFPSYESSFELNKTTRTGKWTKRAYCREFICQTRTTPDCTGNEVMMHDCGCYSCPGNCFYGGRVYTIGDIFKCLDGSNKCKCINTGNVIKLTKRAYSKDTLCEPIHYGACSLYETYEQKPWGHLIKRDTCVKKRFYGRQRDICIEYGCGLDLSCKKTGLNKSAGGGCMYCPEQLGKCKLYSRGEGKGEGCSECRRYPGIDFAEICRDYTCATTNCSMPSTQNGCCPSCPGTCNYGGSVYKAGDKFPCVNGFDKCSCLSTGNVKLRHRWFAIFPLDKVCFSD